MDDIIFIALALLFVKHWYIDFVNQSAAEVASKGTYGSWPGLMHSYKHGAATLVVLLIVGVDPWISLALATADFLVHYHIDWAKMNWGNRDIQNPKFWAHLGLDQLMHYFTYLLIIWIAL